MTGGTSFLITGSCLMFFSILIIGCRTSSDLFSELGVNISSSEESVISMAVLVMHFPGEYSTFCDR